jgi:hypothetical protein
MAVAGVGPVFGVGDEAAGDGVPVHVLQLLNALVMGEYVEVVVAGHPEGLLRRLFGDGDLQSLEGGREEFLSGFAEEKMDVLGHDDVAEEFEAVVSAGCFEGVFDQVSCCGGVEVGLAVVAAEGDEVVVTFLLVSLEVKRHGWILICWVRSAKAHLSDDEAVAKVGHPVSYPDQGLLDECSLFG